MAVNINLLPPELKPKGKYLKLSKTLNKIAKICVVVVLVVGIVVAGVYFVMQYQVKEEEREQNELKAKILRVDNGGS